MKKPKVHLEGNKLPIQDKSILLLQIDFVNVERSWKVQQNLANQKSTMKFLSM